MDFSTSALVDGAAEHISGWSLCLYPYLRLFIQGWIQNIDSRGAKHKSGL